MAETQSFEEPGRGTVRLVIVYGIVLLVVIGLAYWIYTQVTAVRGVAVDAPSPTAIDMLPPPPPPPPPPPEPETKPPEPLDKATPVPSPEPAKTPDAPAPMTIAGPAQAGSDSFGLQSGNGGGIGSPGGTGTCIGANCGVGSGGISDAFYRRYLSSALQERVQENGKVNRLVFTADFSITVAPGGRVTNVALLRSSGKADRDELLKSILESVRGLDPPPASVRFPQKVTVRGRRSL